MRGDVAIDGVVFRDVCGKQDFVRIRSFQLLNPYVILCDNSQLRRRQSGVVGK